jgi:hypothetical protein
MVNEKIVEHKVATFLNSLSFGEMVYLRRFMMSRKWTKFIETRLQNQKIEL